MGKPSPQLSKYDRIILRLFERLYKPALSSIEFTNDELKAVARGLRIEVDNYWDLVYTYRSRRRLPSQITARGEWIVNVLGKGRYAFTRSTSPPHVAIPADLNCIEIPDATPEIVYRYCGSDEQALLAKIRYCRLIDTFVGLAAWHLQGHFKTTLAGGEQVEIDELYVGVDNLGQWHVLPVEAKGSGVRDLLAKSQITAMSKFARERFKHLACRPIAAKQQRDGSIVLIEFTPDTDPELVKVKECRKYALTRDRGGA